MAVRLRLKKFGRRHQSFYRISAMDTRRPRDGRVIEELGWYDPEAKAEHQLSLKRERIEHWLKVGAQPTDRVLRFLDAAGLAKRAPRSNPERAVPGKKAQERATAAATAAAAAAAPPAETPAGG